MKRYCIPKKFLDYRVGGVELPERPDVDALYDIPAKRIDLNFSASDSANVTYVRFTEQYVPPCRPSDFCRR